MDNLTYSYNKDSQGRLTNNRLRHVTDAVGSDSYAEDLSTQGTDNYRYDAIGNLIKDTSADIDNIDWSVYGKIRSITKASGNGNNISYTYDPSGNRVSKTLGTITTYYVRDAQGNVISVYDSQNGVTNWREQHLYGSSRLGMWKPDVNLATSNGNSVWNETGRKFFELNNHLGNVLAVVSDSRTQSGSEYLPVVASAQDYYPFGMIQPGRSFSSGNYRYGFNGKEND